ncbi:MAG: hypothetical protein E6549_09875, partial [Streptococcus sp.]|nr:hypothetical protein [Streptococcus sp.]
KAMESVITKYYKSCIKKGKRSILFISQTKKDIKHTKISSEEISDGREYSLLFLCAKVEVSC